MKAERKTPQVAVARGPRLSGAANASRSVTVRLPVDLYEHLQDVATAGGSDMTKALVGLIRLHRDGSQGAAEVAQMAAGVAQLAAQMADITASLGDLRDEVSLVRGHQGKSIDNVDTTLKLLFALLRDGVPETNIESSGTSSLQPVSSFESEFAGTQDLPVTRMSGSRPLPTPHGDSFR
jgi:hypothetical protein